MVRHNAVLSAALICAVVVVSLIPDPAHAGKPGDAGALFLRFGVGAREAAMGSAGVASTRGASGVFWNPARVVFDEVGTSLVLQHHRYLGAFDHESAALIHKTPAGHFGLLFSGLYSEQITRYSLDEGTGVADGTFRPYDVAVGVSYARPLGKEFSVGMSAKMVYQRIDVYSDTGFAFDFFVAHRAVVEGLYFGASATNIGGKMNLNDGPYDLPRTFRLGAAYTPPAWLSGGVTFTGDVIFPNDTNEKAHLGAEVQLIPEFALRLGTRIGYDSQGMTAGAGFRMGVVDISYAYEEMKTQGFDDGHKFSLTLDY